MKKLLIIIAILSPFILSAQKTITWIGGTPGKETSWNEPKNWDANQVPSEDTHVIINLRNGNTHTQPMLNSEATVASVQIHSNATLSISSTGKLIVDGEYTYSRGISIFGGALKSQGKIILKHIDIDSMNNSESFATLNEVTYYSNLFNYEFTLVD